MATTFIDFQKAFDNNDHSLTSALLVSYRLTGFLEDMANINFVQLFSGPLCK